MGSGMGEADLRLLSSEPYLLPLISPPILSSSTHLSSETYLFPLISLLRSYLLPPISPLIFHILSDIYSSFFQILVLLLTSSSPFVFLSHVWSLPLSLPIDLKVCVYVWKECPSACECLWRVCFRVYECLYNKSALFTCVKFKV